ncbi:hypothetical protein KKA14_21925, partial [bacterium]|nr:hypothetical protein [bacterium]
MKLYKVSLTSLILLFFLCISPYQLKAAKPTLEFLNIKYSEYQSKSDYQGMARVLKKMIDLGYKSVERYKQLGDLYFYIKMDEEALDVFREQAKWANTVETWVNLSNLLIWKQKNKEGINALEKAYQLAPDDDKLTEKLAGVYEFQKMIKQAEQVWLELYNQKGKSVQAGRQVVEFYLRNSMVLQAREVMDELYKKDTDLAGSAELKILDMKINAWTSRPEDAFKAMQRLDIKTIPEKDLDYSFKLALYGGDLIFAEKVLLRFKEIGKDVWNQELELSFIKGNPSETRELIEERIDDKGKNIELVKALYETYRAERKIEGEIDSLEELLQLDYKNSKWHELAMKYYIYYQKHDRGIDVFEDIVDDHEDAQLAVINLCRLYLAGQKYENFEEMIALVTDKSMVPLARELRFQEAYLVDDREKIFNATLDILKYIPNISPEEMVEKLKQEQHPNSEPDESLPNDRYLELTTNLSDLANELGWVKETAEYGRTAYLILKSRYAKYPTKDRLRQLIYWGTDFGSVEERTTDFVEGNKHFSDTEFYLQYYRFLMNQDKFELADAMLKKLFASPTNMEESYQAVEHTFGFVSYNLSKKLFQNIITQDPNYSMGLKRLGQIAHYTDNYLEAAFYLEKY